MKVASRLIVVARETVLACSAGEEVVFLLLEESQSHENGGRKAPSNKCYKFLKGRKVQLLLCMLPMYSHLSNEELSPRSHPGCYQKKFSWETVAMNYRSMNALKRHLRQHNSEAKRILVISVTA